MLTAGAGPRQFDPTGLPLHPILAAAYPVLFLFATNAADQITPQPLWVPLLLSVGAATATLIILGLLLGDWQRAGLLTTVLVIGFFGYGHVWNAASSFLPTQWLLIVAWLLLIVLGLNLAWSAKRAVVPVTRALNLVALVLVAANVWSLGSTMVAFGARPIRHPAS